MDIEAYYQRIGYKNPRNKLDLESLTDIFQHQIRAVPYENLSLHCGESMELDLEAIFDQIVRRERGGWCLQVNYLLYWALTTIGFETTMLGGFVYGSNNDKYSTGMIHLIVQVTISGRNYIVDAGFGRSYQMWQPVELIPGKDQSQVPSIFRLREEGETWYLDQIRKQQHVPDQEFLNSELLEKKIYQKLYCFTLQPRTIEEFESANTYLQESPSSVFLDKSICSLQTPEGVHCLVGLTLTSRTYNYKENTDLVEFKVLTEEEVEGVLKTIFNISLGKKLMCKNGHLSFTI